jgi:hypothetical protein
MSQSKRDDLNLAEVKAVLGRLQQISRKPHSGAQTMEGDGTALPPPPGSTGPAPATGGSSDPPPGMISAIFDAVKTPGHVKSLVVVVLLLAFFASIAVLVGVGQGPAPVGETPAVRNLPGVSEPASVAAPGNPAPAGATAQEVQKSPSASLQVASDLMMSGQVRAARDILLRRAREDSADAAWALARSYDPNYLVTLAAADAGPDVAEATRWYRTWFEIAVKQGLVADSVSLDRIIRSMNELGSR